MRDEKVERLSWWVAVGAIALAGLALRIAAARGGLWTDEAWSMVYAAQARDPLGVFLRINHDNNHHLNSLWLQAIGPAASPFLARTPAILASSLCIVVAAVIAGRRSSAGGIVAALLFAVAPMLVVFGSEARGYGTMLLCALLMILVVGDAVDGRPMRAAAWWLALLALLGMLSHLTMAAPIAIATLWFYLERRSELGPHKALGAAVRLMGPAMATSAGVVLFVFIAASLSATGMQTAGYEPFAASQYLTALDDVALWSAGFSAPSQWVVPLLVGVGAAAILLARPDWLGSRARLYGLLILFVPLAAALLRVGSSGFARFYLASAIGLLLLMSDWAGRGLKARAAVRTAAALFVVTIVAVSLYRDSRVIAVDRGRPAGSVYDMAAMSPTGARVAFDGPRFKAVVAVAAERAGYRARFAGGCDPADFLLAAQPLRTSTPTIVHRCGVEMDAVDSSVTIPITGDSWVLYRAKTLQTSGSADSGRPPAAIDSPSSGRAGVAQG